MFQYLLVHYLHPLEITLCLSLLSLASALLLLKPATIVWRSREEETAKLLVCLVILAIGLGLHSLLMGGIDVLHDISARWQWMGHNLIYYQNSVYGNVSIT